MKIRAFAKINLGLDVVGKREDGYHELKMIMAPIKLHDLITIDIIDSGIELSSNTNRVPNNEKNIMYKVAKKVIDTYQLPFGVKIHCQKHIPSKAGLAGGSSDGAAVIKAMNRLFKLHMTFEDMVKLTTDIGADIPFCIYNKLALVEGIGEKMSFIDTDMTFHILLVKPKKGVSTKKSFQMLQEYNEHPNIEVMHQTLINNDYEAFIDTLGNSLEGPSMKMVKDIEIIKEEMLALGFDGALMSGSGSTVFGLTKDAEILEKGFQHFRNNYTFVRKTELL